jgi:hypothetical protein
MNKWQQEREVMEELLAQEREGLMRCVGKNAQGEDLWELTEPGRRLAMEEMREEFGIWTPVVLFFMRIWRRFGPVW